MRHYGERDVKEKDEIQRLNERIKSLEEGECRFHCRLRKDMWKAGFDWGFARPGVGDPDEEYTKWREQHENDKS